MKQRQWKPRSRLHRMLRRSSVAWWAAALSLGLVTALVTSSAIGRTTRAAEAWGAQREVWVVERAVAAGDVLTRTDVALTRRPKGLIPLGALAATGSPLGEATRVALTPGEVVLAERLAQRGAHGLAALVDRGRRAIALKRDESMPSVRPGDRVDLIATFDVADAPGGEADSTTATVAPSFAVASDAEVLTASPKTITISVSGQEAPRVAFALARAAVTLALRGGASEPARSR